jgi:hypothetical protein
MWETSFFCHCTSTCTYKSMAPKMTTIMILINFILLIKSNGLSRTCTWLKWVLSETLATLQMEFMKWIKDKGRLFSTCKIEVYMGHEFQNNKPFLVYYPQTQGQRSHPPTNTGSKVTSSYKHRVKGHILLQIQGQRSHPPTNTESKVTSPYKHRVKGHILLQTADKWQEV